MYTDDFTIDRVAYRSMMQDIVESGTPFAYGVANAVQAKYTKSEDFLINRMKSRMMGLESASIEGMSLADACIEVSTKHRQAVEITSMGVNQMRKRGVGDPAQMETLDDMGRLAIRIAFYWANARWFCQSQNDALPDDAARLVRLHELFDSAVQHSQQWASEFDSKLAYVSGMRVFTPYYARKQANPPILQQ